MNQLEAFRILASADRQLVLTELLEREGGVSIAEIAKQVAAARHRTSPDSISGDAVESAKIRLIHNHFPRMVEKNIINIGDDNTVSIVDENCVNKLLEAAEELESYFSDGILVQQPPDS